MLATLIPLFDSKMEVKAYSIFAQKKNLFANPSLLGTGSLDGAAEIAGFDIIDNMGLETLSDDREVFVEVNNISLFSAIEEQCKAPHSRIVLLLNNTITPDDTYINRIKELKAKGYKFAIRKLLIEQFEPYRQVLMLMDYMLLNHRKIKMEVATKYFSQIYPDMKLVAVNVDTQEDYDKLTAEGHYDLYEGEFFRVPIVKGETEIAPLKATYIELLNIVNDSDFELTQAADVIGRDAALVISLLKMVNRMTVNSGITSVRHAAAMLGQKELKRWINTAVTKELCSDKPSEITRMSLVRARFSENLATIFELNAFSSELFLMGMFSMLDKMLDKPMSEALDAVKVSKDISDALLKKEGKLAPVYEFVLNYEDASWQEVSRLMMLSGIDMDNVYSAYIQALAWYKQLFGE